MANSNSSRGVAILFAILGACSNGFSKDQLAQGITVAVSPGTATVQVNQSFTFSAAVANAVNDAVGWSVTESTGGSITGAGVYTAPASPGTFHVVAIPTADTSVSAAAVVTVTTTPPPPAVTVSISPAASAVKTGGTAQFAATVANASDNSVTWTVQEAAGGTISASGLYTAPATAATYHVIATSVADASTFASADVVVRSSIPAVGVWTPVTPSNASAAGTFACQNFGAQSVVVDPKRPSDLYAFFTCQGIWKSTDFGYTWTGPINTGTNGPSINGAGGITIPSGSTTSPPLMYAAMIRDPGTGFWKSVDGGVSWTKSTIAPTPTRQDYYPPVADPYDVTHLIMPGHEMNSLVTSADGGQTWTSVHTEAGMQQSGGTAFVFFIDTGSSATTRTTMLWIAQQVNGSLGTWRTTNGGTNWVKVDNNEHPHGYSQIYQPGNGVVYMAGAYSALQWGVLRSADYGQTWAHFGTNSNEAGIIGTAKSLYAIYGWAAGVGQVVNPNVQTSAQPGTGTWTGASTPSLMTQGPAQIAVTNDGTHAILVTANFNAGLWFYSEP
jgi:hypothetical protein